MMKRVTAEVDLPFTLIDRLEGKASVFLPLIGITKKIDGSSVGCPFAKCPAVGGRVKPEM
jgi:hypothetical protein